MNNMNISQNILEVRKKYKYTQQELAEFLNISKAAVSKWEQGHSMPDINYIGEMAVLFDISIDELIGFSPQLSKSDIRAVYNELATAFTSENYDDVLEKVRSYGKRYYNCYPFLTTLTNLLVNHLKLTTTPGPTVKLVDEFINRVINNTDVPQLKEQMTFYKSAMLITNNKPEEVSGILSDYIQPKLPINALLAQAHLMTDKPSKAKTVLQVEIYEAVIFIMNDLTMLLYTALYEDINEMVKRGEDMDKAFNLKILHPSSTLNFYIVAAMKLHEDRARCLFYLNEFLECVKNLANDYYLHGDEFFTEIDDWLQNLDIGKEAPVNLLIAKEQILDSVLNNEAFKNYQDDIAFKNIVHTLKTVLEADKYEHGTQ